MPSVDGSPGIDLKNLVDLAITRTEVMPVKTATLHA